VVPALTSRTGAQMVPAMSIGMARGAACVAGVMSLGISWRHIGMEFAR
jgi:hypothetical protein